MRFRLRLAAMPGILAGGVLLHACVWAGGTHDADRGLGEAIGKPGNPAKANQSVSVEMSDDMKFSPTNVRVRRGETIRFIVHNSGKVKHEFVLGTEKALKEHYEMMKKFPEMEHADPNMVTVAPGETGEVVWTFTKSGQVDFACLQPGHYEAGMKGRISVQPEPGKGGGHGTYRR